MAKVKTIISDKKEFNIDKIMNSSKAAGGMAKWCMAIHKYAETLKIVRPKGVKSCRDARKVSLRNARS